MLTNEMDRFKNDLDITSFYNATLNEFFTNKSFSALDLSIEQVKDKIQNKTGAQFYLLIKHSKDTSNIEVNSKIGTLANIIIRRMLTAFNHQHQHNFYSEKEKRFVQSRFRFSDPHDFKLDSFRMIQNRLELIVRQMPLQEKTTLKSISGRLGKKIYIYYHPYRTKNEDGIFIDGGYMLILGKPDISKIFQSSVKAHNINAVRSYRFVNNPFPKPIDNALLPLTEPITKFSIDEKGAHLTSIAPPVFLKDMINQNNFYPQNLQTVLENMPLLKVSIPTHELQHRLFRYRNLIKNFMIIFVIAGAVLAIYIFLYGINFKGSITKKTILGIILILLFPLSFLVASFLTLREFQKLDRYYKKEESLQRQTEHFQNQINQYLDSLQLFTIDLAEKLSSKTHRETKDFFNNIINDITASELLFFGVSKPDISVVKDDPDAKLTRYQRTAMDIFGFSLMTALTQNLETGNRTRQQGILHQPMGRTLTNHILNSNGKLFEYERLEGQRFSSAMINEDYNNPKILALRYTPRSIIFGFFSQYFQSHNNSNKRFFTIDRDGLKQVFYEIVPVTNNSGIEFVETNQAFLTDNLLTAYNSGAFPLLTDNQQLLYYLPAAHLPLIVMSQGKTDFFEMFNMLNIMLLYPLLLLIFATMIFSDIYLKPILQLVDILKKASQGIYDLNIVTTEVDEFGTLKKTFKTMIQGVKEREEMSKYVSSAVNEAITGELNETAKSRKIEAAVVFATLKTAHSSEDEKNLNDYLNTLSKFIAESDQCAIDNNGVLDKIIENTVMLVFRGKSSDVAAQACKAALQLAGKFGDKKVQAAIATGKVVSGKTGSKHGKLDLTVIGDTVNLAARLENEASNALNTGIVISPSTIRALKGRVKVEFIKRTPIKGKSRSFPIYELLNLR